MAKPIYAGTYPSQKRGRFKRVFITVLLLQIVVVAGIFLYLKRGKTEEGQKDLQNNVQTTGQRSSNGGSAAGSGKEENLTDTVSTSESRAVVQRARTAVRDGNLIAAKRDLDALIETTPDADAIKLLGDVNMTLLLGASMDLPGMQRYTIKSGDSLSRIAGKFNTTVELIKKMNNLTTDLIHPNNNLFVFDGNFSIHVSKTYNYLDLLSNGKLFKRYSVGTGKMGKTPSDTFTIYDKMKDPAWTRPSDRQIIEFGDPENLLGTRWMAIESPTHSLDDGFGIHGTWENDSIGKQSSSGCIRMINAEVEELFDLVVRKTVVEITD
ncbi:MAG: L,D-transpeptidase family protein [Pontiellaceae bacterium]|nr:L,D-transpeptidase family protein [Pontiellaceae bacterium]